MWSCELHSQSDSGGKAVVARATFAHQDSSRHHCSTGTVPTMTPQRQLRQRRNRTPARLRPPNSPQESQRTSVPVSSRPPSRAFASCRSQVPCRRGLHGKSWNPRRARRKTCCSRSEKSEIWFLLGELKPVCKGGREPVPPTGTRSLASSHNLVPSGGTSLFVSSG
jgi:hypothetical protein